MSSQFTALLAQIVVPTMLLDERRARRNIAAMAEKARRSGVRFRPHFKTHQSAAVGEWFRAEGVTAITASSLDMAIYFADHGWRDIMVAFPANVREMAKINDLAARVCLHLLVDSPATVGALAPQLTAPVGVWIEVDAGYQRSGVAWSSAADLYAVAEAVAQAPQMALLGLLTHAGNTYGATSTQEVLRLHDATLTRLQRACNWLLEYGFLGLEISIGDTPACSVLEAFAGVDEVRPGNFVFYDVMQEQIGACGWDDIALVVACPVVGVYPARYEIVVYGGAVHLSKDSLRQTDGSVSFGAVGHFDADGWGAPLPGVKVRSLSQEHGILQAEAAAFAAHLANVRVGDLVAVYPVHSCLTADLLKQYRTLDGAAIDMAPIPR
jgi:D-serine deaminase-like pyridoxal phosphate-dependent protein